jgi:hypothetical protein
LLIGLLGCDGVSDVFFVRETGFSVGCETTVWLSDGFAKDLEPDGCGYMVTAFSAAEDTKLSLDVPAFADLLTEGKADATYKLPDDAVRLTAEAGCGMKRGWCDQSGTPGTSWSYEPAGGTVTVTGTGLDAKVSLTDVFLAGDAGTVYPGDVEWTVTLYPTP